jgi:hypothetical protein
MGSGRPIPAHLSMNSIQSMSYSHSMNGQTRMGAMNIMGSNQKMGRPGFGQNQLPYPMGPNFNKRMG